MIEQYYQMFSKVEYLKKVPKYPIKQCAFRGGTLFYSPLCSSILFMHDKSVRRMALYAAALETMAESNKKYTAIIERS